MTNIAQAPAPLANKLFFFTDLYYAPPMDHYNYGCVAARDAAHAIELLGTNKVDFLFLANTDTEGQLFCAADIRQMPPRAKSEPRQIECSYYKAKDDHDLTDRVSYIAELLASQYGFEKNQFSINMREMLKIEGEHTSDGKPKWRAMVTIDGVEQPQPIFLTFEESTDADNFELTDKKEMYEYNVSVDLPVVPVWHLVDLLQAADLEDAWTEAAFVARNACYSAQPVDGWEEVKEVFGNHTLTWWLNPNWQEMFKGVVDALKAEHALQLEAEAVSPLNIETEGTQQPGPAAN